MLKTYENKYIRTLLNITHNMSNSLRTKHAAMLIDGGKIISIGMNKSKSDPIQKMNSINHKIQHKYLEYSWIHAEVDCLKKLKMDFRRSTIVVIRTDKMGKINESCPCLGCMRLIDRLEIPRIIHSTMDGGIRVIQR